MNFDIEDTVRQLQGGRLTKSFFDFFCKFWYINSSDYLNKNWHIEYLCGLLSELLYGYMEDKRRHRLLMEKKDRYEVKNGIGSYKMESFGRSTKHILINIPPRSSKSLIASVNFPVWAWTKDPTLKFICVSYSEDLSLFLSRQSMKLIESHDFMDLFAKSVSLGKNTAVGNFSLVGAAGSDEDTGWRRSVGVGGTVTGTGSDFIIVDDPIKPADAESMASDKVLESCKLFYDTTLSSRLNNPAIGVKIVIMQRLHEKDLSGHILDSIDFSFYDHISLPAETKSTYSVVKPQALRGKYKGDLLWPDRWPENVLREYNNQMGDAYYGQYLQTPVRPGGAIIRRDWLRVTDYIPDDCSRNFIFLDTAYTEDKQNNPTGVLVCTVDYHTNVVAEQVEVKTYGTIYVLLAEEVWLEFSDLKNHLMQLISEYTKKGHPPSIFIEPKASGKSIYQGLKKSLPGLPVFEIKGDIVDRKDKRGRLSACSVQIHNGNLVFLKDNTMDDKKNWNKLLENQLCTFPYSKNDDLVDCISYAFWVTHKSREMYVGTITLDGDKAQRKGSFQKPKEKAGELINLKPDPSRGGRGNDVPEDPIAEYVKNVMGKNVFDL